MRGVLVFDNFLKIDGESGLARKEGNGEIKRKSS